ncbi:hypothetical protein [Haloarchaeobius sp. DFWS5]|uniref:hypothetical protein n=1 Tax=Haloarchaeobius sp. DFWS5 TaxID=3446114 RepID=UPI003EBFA688
MDGYWRAAGEVPTSLSSAAVTLEPGETYGQTFDLLVSADHDGTIPTGFHLWWTSIGEIDIGLELSVWPTSAEKPAESTLSPTDLPALPGGTTHWFHDARTEDATMFVEPDGDDVLELPESVYAMLRNYRGESVSLVGPTVFKREQERWVSLGSPGYNGMDIGVDVPSQHALMRRVRPGESVMGALAVKSPLTTTPGGETVFVPFLRNGLYAIRWYDLSAQQNYAMTISVVGGGEHLSTLAPGDSAVVTDEADGTLRVRSELAADADRPATLVLSREDGDVDAPRLILEQVGRVRGLQNTLPYLRADVDRTRVELTTSLRAVDTTLESLDWDAATPGSFSFDGETYRASTPKPNPANFYFD